MNTAAGMITLPSPLLLQVRIGEAEVELSPGFSLFLFTRDASARIAPDTASRLCVVDFTVTPVSLRAQVLARILESEAPHVYARRAEVLEAQSQRDARLQVRWRRGLRERAVARTLLSPARPQALEERLLAELAAAGGGAAAPAPAAPAAAAASGIPAPRTRGAAKAAAPALATAEAPSAPSSSLLDDDRLLRSLEAIKSEAEVLGEDIRKAAGVLRQASGGRAGAD